MMPTRYFLWQSLLILVLCPPPHVVSFTESTSRKAFLSTTAALLLPPPPAALAVVDAGETIRRSAANIPGYGPTDVFYPLAWKGTWNVDRQVIINGGNNTINLRYNIRFLTSIDDNAVVADRAYNQENLEKSLRGDDAVRSITWSETNPNDLRMIMKDGSRKDIKVTKRSSETGEGVVSSSEFQRVSEEDSRGIPVVTARRVLTKWKTVDENTLEAIEVVYDMGAGGDPLSMSAGPKEPKVLSKSRIRLKRAG